MKTELISVETEDGVVLHGAFYENTVENPAVIILPGAAMNFYTGLGRFLPAILLENGYSCLSANHRGHDFGTAPDFDGKPVIGLMRDRFKDCIKDVQTLLAFIKKRGYKRAVIIGHSQAIPKILYALNCRLFPEVMALVLVSPPPSVEKMIRFLVGDDFYERGLFKARELTGLGMPDQLIVLKGRGTMPWAFTASTFIDFYGPDTPADTEILVRNISCPILLLRGTRDFKPVSLELLKSIQENAGRPDKCTIIEIEGADHFYVNYQQVLGNNIVEWLRSLG